MPGLAAARIRAFHKGKQKLRCEVKHHERASYAGASRGRNGSN
jgi:hypothetical protein